MALKAKSLSRKEKVSICPIKEFNAAFVISVPPYVKYYSAFSDILQRNRPAFPDLANVLANWNNFNAKTLDAIDKGLNIVGFPLIGNDSPRSVRKD